MRRFLSGVPPDGITLRERRGPSRVATDGSGLGGGGTGMTGRHDRSAAVFETVAAECVDRLVRGQSPTIVEYGLCCPRFADEPRNRFPLLETGTGILSDYPFLAMRCGSCPQAAPGALPRGPSRRAGRPDFREDPARRGRRPQPNDMVFSQEHDWRR